MQWLDLGPITSNLWHCFNFVFCLFGKIVYNVQNEIMLLLWGKENFGRKSHKYEVCVRSRFLTSPSWHLTVRPPTPWFLWLFTNQVFFIQCSCCDFSFSFYPDLWRNKLWKFEAMSLETNCDKLFEKTWSNIAPNISGRGAACYCHFQAPGENKNIPSHSRHIFLIRKYQ